MQKLDFLVVGAGIAGAGVAYRLAGHGATMLVDMEEQAGYHTTGRSAAFYAETYGGEKLQPLTTASKEFLHSPPLGFVEAPLITELGAIHVFDADQEAAAEKLFAEDKKKLPHIELLSTEELRRVAPQLKTDRYIGGIRDMECGDLDVAALHHGYIKAAKKMGVEVKLEAQFEKAERTENGWRVQLGREEVETRVIVNSAGAWGDQVAERCGLEPIGLTPLRRTLATIPNPDGLPFDKDLPMIIDFDETFYFKPEGNGYLISPADETPSVACDSQPDIEDVAIAVDHFERATGASVDKLEAKWAGLRTFAPDRAPVIGFEPGEDGFFWNVGQGGYGIQTSPAWSRYVAFLLLGKGMPEDLSQAGAKASWYDPARFRK